VLVNNAPGLVPQHLASTREVEFNDQFLAFVAHWEDTRTAFSRPTHRQLADLRVQAPDRRLVFRLARRSTAAEDFVQSVRRWPAASRDSPGSGEPRDGRRSPAPSGLPATPWMRTPERTDDDVRVTLSTLHGVMGLEFDTVVIVSFDAGTSDSPPLDKASPQWRPGSATLAGRRGPTATRLRFLLAIQGAASMEAISRTLLATNHRES